MDTSDPSVWTCSSQEALNVHLAEPSRAVTFPPKFTYPIFGDSEQIFGYKDLKIDLAFDCCSLKPLLTYKFSEQLLDGVKSIEDTVGPFLPKDDFILKSEEKWLDAIEEEKFELPKEKIETSYDIGEDHYDIYKFSLVNDPVGLKLHLRMQIFVLLYIEAGSYITSDDPKWELYVIYKTTKGETKSTFVGFTTVYKHFHFESSKLHDSTPFEELKFKGKISQFVILPPFQRQGHGKRMYNFIVDKWMGDFKCVQITVEDPSEEFDELRDHCDVLRLIQSGKLDDLMELPVQYEDINLIVKDTKLVKRQLSRCIEMGLIWKLNNNNTNGVDGLNERNVRQLIKKRLYLSNKEALDEMEKAECFDKLQTTYQCIREGYNAMIEGISIGVKRSLD